MLKSDEIYTYEIDIDSYLYGVLYDEMERINDLQEEYEINDPYLTIKDIIDNILNDFVKKKKEKTKC